MNLSSPKYKIGDVAVTKYGLFVIGEIIHTENGIVYDGYRDMRTGNSGFRTKEEDIARVL